MPGISEGFDHVGDGAGLHLEAPRVRALVVLGAQLRDEVGRVVAGVVRDVRRHRAQRARVGLHREHLMVDDEDSARGERPSAGILGSEVSTGN